MPLEQQIQTIQTVKQQAVGFAANPLVLSREGVLAQDRTVRTLLDAQSTIAATQPQLMCTMCSSALAYHMDLSKPMCLFINLMSPLHYISFVIWRKACIVLLASHPEYHTIGFDIVVALACPAFAASTIDHDQ